MEDIARNGLYALRKREKGEELSLDERDAIPRWFTANTRCCTDPKDKDAAAWFRHLAKDVMDFPAAAQQDVLKFKWYHSFGETALLTSVGTFFVSLAASSRHVLTIVEALVAFLSTPQEFPAGNKVQVHGSEFESPQALKQKCRSILYSSVGTNVEKEDAAFMRALLACHPHNERVVPEGTDISVGQHPQYPHNCFFFRNAAGELEDFSYRRCAENIKTANSITQAHICEVVAQILRLCPSITLATSKLLEDRIPYWQSKRAQITDHRNYLQALLYLAESSSVLTDPLLRFVLRKLGDLDLEVVEQEEGGAVLADEESFDFNAQLLDALMVVTFEFLQSRLSRRQDVSKDEVSRFVCLIFGVFEETTFAAPKSRHVQFIYFYICSLNVEWTEEFLIRLLRLLYTDGYADNVQEKKKTGAQLSALISRSGEVSLNEIHASNDEVHGRVA